MFILDNYLFLEVERFIVQRFLFYMAMFQFIYKKYFIQELFLIIQDLFLIFRPQEIFFNVQFSDNYSKYHHAKICFDSTLFVELRCYSK